MSRGFRQSQAWLHTWSGLLVGWVLFAMFLTGTSAYWRDELSRWSMPELGAVVETATASHQALAWLERHAAGADSWTIQLPGPRSAGTQVSWRTPGQSPRAATDTRTWLGADGEAVTVPTRIANPLCASSTTPRRAPTA